MKKLKIFFSLTLETKLLLLEAFIFLAWGSILKKIPFRKITPFLGESMEETPFSRENIDVKVLKKVSQSIQLMSRYTLWESKCLVKAIAAMKMLDRRKIESTLYLGTGKDESGKLAAHAWLRSGPFYVTGADGMERYTVVGKFANRFLNEIQKGESNGT
jgi:hypothetical protein